MPNMNGVLVSTTLLVLLINLGLTSTLTTGEALRTDFGGGVDVVAEEVDAPEDGVGNEQLACDLTSYLQLPHKMVEQDRQTCGPDVSS